MSLQVTVCEDSDRNARLGASTTILLHNPRHGKPSIAGIPMTQQVVVGKNTDNHESMVSTSGCVKGVSHGVAGRFANP